MNFSININALKIMISFSIFFVTIYYILHYFNIDIILIELLKNKNRIHSKALVYDGKIIQCFSALRNITYDNIRGIWFFYFIYKFLDDRLLNDFMTQFGIKKDKKYSNIILIKSGYRRKSKTLIFRANLDHFDKVTKVYKISFIDESYNIIKSFSPRKKNISFYKDKILHDIIFSTYVLTYFTLTTLCKTYEESKYIPFSFKKNLDENDIKEIEKIKKQDEEDDTVYFLFSSLEKYID